MTKRTGLGRGLGALFPTEPAAGQTPGLLEVAVSDIEPNPRQPRSVLNEETLAELAASIREHGLIQPLIVTRSDSGYTLIAGERRWRAAQLAGQDTVPVVVKEITPQEMLEVAIIENIQREDLNAIEEALAYAQLMDEFGLTQEAVAERVGKGRSTVTNLVRLLTLPPEVQQAVLDNELTGTHARELLRLPDSKSQIAAKDQIVRRKLNRREAAKLVDKMLSADEPGMKPPREPLSPEMLALQERFVQSLGTRVSIEKLNKGGKVVIYYYSDEELQAIYDSIVDDESTV
ncbi:MAG: ParB/RepB/Spo0J family partition protein [Candidatus Promineifilaceae bacterium]|jgi:ParB family chromosome partitioning protein